MARKSFRILFGLLAAFALSGCANPSSEFALLKAPIGEPSGSLDLHFRSHSSEKTMRLSVDESTMLEAYALPDYVRVFPEFTVIDPEIISVSPKGAVTALQAGHTTIEASYVDANGNLYVGEEEIIVSDSYTAVISWEVPGSLAIEVGEMVDLADYLSWKGTGDPVFEFESLNPDIAEVDRFSGVLTGLSEGEAYIDAIADGCSGRLIVNVGSLFGYCLNADGSATVNSWPNREEVVFPSSIHDIPVTRIEASSQYANQSIRRIVIPEGVRELGDGAFNGCSSLTEAVLPSTLETIGGSAFGNCGKLTSVTGFNAVSVGNSAFYSCPLTGFGFGERLQEIGDYAFRYLQDEVVYLPSSIVKIGDHSFPEGTIIVGNLDGGLSSVSPDALLYDSDFYFRLEGAEALLLGYYGQGKAAEVPGEVWKDGKGYPVTGFADAPYFSPNLFALSLPSSFVIQQADPFVGSSIQVLAIEEGASVWLGSESSVRIFLLGDDPVPAGWQAIETAVGGYKGEFGEYQGIDYALWTDSKGQECAFVLALPSNNVPQTLVHEGRSLPVKGINLGGLDFNNSREADLRGLEVAIGSWPIPDASTAPSLYFDENIRNFQTVSDCFAFFPFSKEEAASRKLQGMTLLYDYAGLTIEDDRVLYALTSEGMVAVGVLDKVYSREYEIKESVSDGAADYPVVAIADTFHDFLTNAFFNAPFVVIPETVRLPDHSAAYFLCHGQPLIPEGAEVCAVAHYSGGFGKTHDGIYYAFCSQDGHAYASILYANAWGDPVLPSSIGGIPVEELSYGSAMDGYGEFTIPSSVKRIVSFSPNVAYYHRGLIEQDVPEGIRYYPNFAAEVTRNQMLFVLYEDGDRLSADLISYAGEIENVYIPGSIGYRGESYIVRRIEAEAFDLYSIARYPTIYLPDTIEFLGDDCLGPWTADHIPSSLKKVGSNVFNNNYGALVMPSGIEELASDAGDGYIYIPSSIKIVHPFTNGATLLFESTGPCEVFDPGNAKVVFGVKMPEGNL